MSRLALASSQVGLVLLAVFLQPVLHGVGHAFGRAQPEIILRFQKSPKPVLGAPESIVFALPDFPAGKRVSHAHPRSRRNVAMAVIFADDLSRNLDEGLVA